MLHGLFTALPIKAGNITPNSDKKLPSSKMCMYTTLIVHFTDVCLVAKPLNRNEDKSDLVMIQTLLLFKCKLICYHAN